MKSYVTPMLSFESFELTSNTASACGKPTRTPTNRTCGVTVPGVGNVFFDGVAGCDYPGADGDYSVCYDVPLDWGRAQAVEKPGCRLVRSRVSRQPAAGGTHCVPPAVLYNKLVLEIRVPLADRFQPGMNGK